MHGNVPVRFGRGRLDSLGNKGLAAYLIRKTRTASQPRNAIRWCETQHRPVVGRGGRGYAAGGARLLIDRCAPPAARLRNKVFRLGNNESAGGPP
jgi:hypothetical protein